MIQDVQINEQIRENVPKHVDEPDGERN